MATKKTKRSAGGKTALARQFFIDVFSKGRLDVVDKTFARNYVGHSSASFTGPIKGFEGIKEFVSTYRTAFPNIRFSFDDILATGNKIVARFTARGTHTGTFLGLPPTGKQMKVSGIGIADVANNVIVRTHSQINVLDMLQQLGVVPPTEQLVRLNQ
jgi:steroid delta-isomerase-like uncharacterized protein